MIHYTSVLDLAGVDQLVDERLAVLPGRVTARVAEPTLPHVQGILPSNRGKVEARFPPPIVSVRTIRSRDGSAPGTPGRSPNRTPPE